MIPVLEIQTCTLVLPLPIGAKILVKKGEQVEEGTFLAESNEQLKEFDLAKTLKVDGQRVGRYLTTHPGAAIKEGQIIARKKSLLSETVFKSPLSGILNGLTDQGVLKIRIGERQPTKAPVAGKITNFDLGVLSLEYQAMVLTGGEGMGATNWGEISLLEEPNLPETVQEKIFILVEKIPAIFSYKAEALGAAGIVGAELGGEVKLQELVVLLAGGKDGLLSSEIWDILKKYQGRKALISGEEKTLKIPL